ncbi:Ras2 [Monocercomonoides exilis]|uniref:Ras2 n=1 Tax=Monocercomonoides exilis TaxID=2049356 RepID=UPI00355A8E2B|nr:Ras2 [Monocercomonoides exilis]|eukprot:MONOS_16773.1-p1 / transcript=MONOS_16773.1 / gene=MONOS_16773 / organism=Monocercomonoides_exilis_PA203 / gene_product=Ras2 / transcript_product=Ras2 / location=Mono_scaffold00130:92581-93549(+) / protein_length=184 / sequence_SO=supercontig / SO=protein_coding / is_pseudo=false
MTMDMKIVILGGGGVGKSNIAIQFVMKKFIPEYDPTVEDQYRMQTTVDDKTVYLDILDTAGQEEFTGLQDNYILNGDGFILVYAIDSRPSFDEVRKIRDRILSVKEKEKVPIVICANKQDLPSQYHQVSSQEGKDMSKSFGCQVLETSAKERVNVTEAFHTLVREIRKERDPPPKPPKFCFLF